jgi:spore maturation protein CgeB
MNRVLIVDTAYPRFLSEFYADVNDIDALSYAELWRLQMDKCLGMADFYVANLRKLGIEADLVVANDPILQARWIEEHGKGAIATESARAGLLSFARSVGQKWYSRSGAYGRRIYELLRGPVVELIDGGSRAAWQMAILHEQIRSYRPDILLVHPIGLLSREFLEEARAWTRWIVGQHASPVPAGVPYSQYDLMLSSLPNLVALFREERVASEYLRLGFDSSVLARIKDQDHLYSSCFVGGFSSNHRQGVAVLEALASNVSIDFWGYGGHELPEESQVRQRYHGEAWGIDMYRILAQSKIALNRHIDVAENYANNMRLYEATGVGSLLITDNKDNLHELFEVGDEVVAYDDIDDCVGLVKYYLENETERKRIALAGQNRTLRDHSYFNRMQELVELLSSLSRL